MKRRSTLPIVLLVLLCLQVHAGGAIESHNIEGISFTLTLSGIRTNVTAGISHLDNDYDQNQEQNTLVNLSIDLAPLVAAFPDRLKESFYKRSCRERVEVRHASLRISENALIADSRIWIEKRLCEGPIKTRIFEKTGDVQVVFTPHTEPGVVRLVADIQRTGLLLAAAGKVPFSAI